MQKGKGVHDCEHSGKVNPRTFGKVRQGYGAPSGLFLVARSTRIGQSLKTLDSTCFLSKDREFHFSVASLGRERSRALSLCLSRSSLFSTIVIVTQVGKFASMSSAVVMASSSASGAVGLLCGGQRFGSSKQSSSVNSSSRSSVFVGRTLLPAVAAAGAPRRRLRAGPPSLICAAVEKTSREVVYDPQSRYNELIDDLSKSGSIPQTNLTLFSPCKINVFLRVTKKRPDGYHDLASLFHVISLGDVIKFSVSPSQSKDSLTTNVSGVPLDENNLIIKALNLYRKKTGSSTYFWIHLDKRVPTGAGLGGGSGNAATALWAANQLCGKIATEQELQEWSGEIGSDIPVFFSKGAAYCTGKGEVVRDIPSPFDSSTPMVLMKPPEECSTPEIFKNFKLSDSSQADPEELLDNVIKNGITQSLCINDLEAPAFQVLPALKQLKERISAGSRGRYQAVFMTGSGSTIVGVGDVEPPPFLYDEEQYSSVFISEAYFLTRKENEWYKQPRSGEEE